ncbi:MAG: hypothetical protein LAT50_09815 [Ectothiorhodospiraceae bacterium]|nr:hypothetical protein [Ectothiorhodospiraceae bacterium]
MSARAALSGNLPRRPGDLAGATIALVVVTVLATAWFLAPWQDEGAPTGPGDAEACVEPAATSAMNRLRQQYSQARACWPAPDIDVGVEALELGPLPPVEHPADNPSDADKAELGKHLFFDPRLSGSRQIACASCHDPDLGWGDGRRRPFGHDRLEGSRNSPTLLNAGHHELLMWDGRLGSLEEQALMALTNPLEMNADLEETLERLAAIPGYRQRFLHVFGSENITGDRLGMAIATFVRPINSRTSRFDRFLNGEHHALDDAQLRGLHLFRTRGRCMNCHHGPLLTDGDFHNLGLHFQGRTLEDLGRYRVTGDPADVGAFRTPPLRDVTLRGPWMHNGLFLSLDSVLNFYNAGGAHPAPRKSPETEAPTATTSTLLQPLQLSEQERRDLIAFLNAISRTPTRVSPPERLLKEDSE